MPHLGGLTAIVSDPPYGIGFMGKGWDKSVPGIDFWTPILNSCLPGANLFAFGGCRTYHRMVCAIEDSGWEINNFLSWMFGSGFPKSTDISKQIDKKAGAEREVLGSHKQPAANKPGGSSLNMRVVGMPKECKITAPAPDDAKTWDGWKYGKQNLKPAMEPICYAQKPFDGTGFANALEHGVSGLWIDGGRVETDEIKETHAYKGEKPTIYNANASYWEKHNGNGTSNTKGRYPANICHDGSACVVGEFPVTGPSNGMTTNKGSIWGSKNSDVIPAPVPPLDSFIVQRPPNVNAGFTVLCARTLIQYLNGLNIRKTKPIQKI